MKNNFSIVNPMLIGGHKNCLNPYKIRDCNKNNYRELSRNR